MKRNEESEDKLDPRRSRAFPSAIETRALATLSLLWKKRKQDRILEPGPSLITLHPSPEVVHLQGVAKIGAA